ncbi:Major Facilitator Superfamily protein [Polystyrenella longa]|uniref:Major Facilitator Superfamily protein n=1 Tax=Polystyrenella longa TaxID=2528007 RepID=A0A518CSA1_9PLAN|nr:MFS transporter [Polystyrenella longa]QDU82098.1 Major Facilitator Superfamily protein [Polystyrenella longa]
MSETNRFPLFLASFLTLIAAGIGFAIRGAILGDWSAQFGFTKGELGGITGGGLVGFGVIILFFSLFADKVGYKPLMVLAFLMHVASALLTLAATPIYESMGKDACYNCLYWGMFLFAIANGLCETVINPLTANLYPKQKTHYLNILHAGWPGGLIVGGVIAFFVCGSNAMITHLRWEIPMMLFLIPTVVYGFIVLKEKFPESEAKAAGVSYGSMFTIFASPIFLLLLLLHAMVGYVELGTDSWITNIMENVIPGNAILLFIYTSGLMFVLRFFAGPIVEKVNPVGLLLGSAILGCLGLVFLSMADMAITILAAATVYGLGKTFLWPTMLGVVGERFPQGGAISMGALGGIGMLSAGLLGGPGIGYEQDYFASKQLEAESPETYEEYKSDEAKGFLFFPKIAGLDGEKVAELKELRKADKKDEETKLTPEQDMVLSANMFGGRQALLYTAIVPFMMAIGYLILVIYFRAKGGYKQEVLHGKEPDGEHYTGGVEGPVK